jgi:sugar O-acyltransferase (sialic acid O-acetyltransferase NeuD family)
MTGDLVVYGAGGQARETAEVASRSGWRVVAYLDLRPGADVHQVPVLAEGDRPAGVPAALGLGEPDRRRRVFERCAAGSCWPTLTHPSAVVSPAAAVDGTAGLVQAGAVVSCDVRVGRGVLVNYGATIGHDAELGEFAVVLPGASVSGGVRVGAGALIGSRAVVLPGLSVGRSARVGAGAVVTKDVPDNCTVVGVPATVVR